MVWNSPCRGRTLGQRAIFAPMQKRRHGSGTPTIQPARREAPGDARPHGQLASPQGRSFVAGVLQHLPALARHRARPSTID